MVRAAVLSGILSLFLSAAFGQVRLDPFVAEKLLIERPDPVYPNIAMRARISGSVHLLILVSETGSVKEVKCISGPVPLRDAAVMMVRQSRYAPFLSDNKPVPFYTTITVPYDLDESFSAFKKHQKLGIQYTGQESQCRELINQSKWTEAEASCKANLEIVGKMNKLGTRLKMQAYTLAGLSMFHQNKYEETLQYLNKAYKFGQSTGEEPDSDFGNILVLMGVTSSKMNKLKDAMDYYEKGVQTLLLVYANPNINSKMYEKEKNLCLARLKTGLDNQIKTAESLGKTSKVEDLKKRLAALP